MVKYFTLNLTLTIIAFHNFFNANYAFILAIHISLISSCDVCGYTNGQLNKTSKFTISKMMMAILGTS